MNPRRPLSKQAVVDAALTLADRDGLSALTIRRLGAEVGAPPMSLYVHFAGKEQLLDLMFDRLVQHLFPAHGSPAWEDELATAGRHARSVLMAHPHWIPLLTRTAVPVSSLGFYDHFLHLMAEDGFSWDAATHAFSSVMAFALGFVLTERMMTPQPGNVVPLQRIVQLREAMPRFGRGVYPRIASSKAALERWSFDRVFEMGLGSLIAGIQRSVLPSRPVKRRRSS